MVDVLAVHIHQHLKQRVCHVQQMGRDGHGCIGVLHVHIGHPQAVRKLPAVLDMKALHAQALQMQQARLQGLQRFNAGQNAFGKQLLGLGAGLSDFMAALQCDDTEWRTRALAFAHHIEVAYLEHAQAQVPAGKQDCAQREQGQRMQT